MDAKMIEEIKAQCEAATAGTWETDYKNRYVFTSLDDGQKMVAEMRISGGQISNPEQEANAHFIAHARTDIPALLSHIEAQQDALDKSEADKAVLVEALGMAESALSLMHHRKHDDLIQPALSKAIAALASVKGEA